MTAPHLIRTALSAARRLSTATLVAIAVVAVVCAFTLAYRYAQERRGVGAVASPSLPAEAFAGEVPPTGSFSARVAYTCFGVPDPGEVSSEVAWDDAWFYDDARAYNHGLARAASVLSAIAYSESEYYKEGGARTAYMENALAELGFTRVDTSSYRYRSEVVDEVLDMVTDESDGVAYTVASKPVADGGRTGRTLVAVIVRGSYGSEWLSNFDVLGSPERSSAADLEQRRSQDHAGYQRAAAEIEAVVRERCSAVASDGGEPVVLLCGHSRGGAVAGLVAAMLDDAAAAGGSAVPAESVFAYTFASPRTTLSTEDGGDRYGNIFNVLNPADPVTRLPLESWGYTRYGMDVLLPSVDDGGFPARYAAFEDGMRELTGGDSPYVPETKRTLDTVIMEMSAAVETPADLVTPAGAAKLAATLVTRIDPLTILGGHYPSVYIAWMHALDADALPAPRPDAAPVG